MIRYEPGLRGDMLHLDIKKPGRFDGHRITGDRRKLLVRGRLRRPARCIDDASRPPRELNACSQRISGPAAPDEPCGF